MNKNKTKSPLDEINTWKSKNKYDNFRVISFKNNIIQIVNDSGSRTYY